MCQKRLSQGKFRSWVDNKHGKQKALDAHELQMLLWNGSSNVAPMWKKIAI